LKDLDSSKANLKNITDGFGPNQDASLAIGKGVTTQDFLSIPPMELEIWGKMVYLLVVVWM